MISEEKMEDRATFRNVNQGYLKTRGIRIEVSLGAGVKVGPADRIAIYYEVPDGSLSRMSVFEWVTAQPQQPPASGAPDAPGDVDTRVVHMDQAKLAHIKPSTAECPRKYCFVYENYSGRLIVKGAPFFVCETEADLNALCGSPAELPSSDSSFDLVSFPEGTHSGKWPSVSDQVPSAVDCWSPQGSPLTVSNGESGNTSGTSSLGVVSLATGGRSRGLQQRQQLESWPVLEISSRSVSPSNHQPNSEICDQSCDYNGDDNDDCFPGNLSFELLSEAPPPSSSQPNHNHSHLCIVQTGEISSGECVLELSKTGASGSEGDFPLPFSPSLSFPDSLSFPNLEPATVTIESNSTPGKTHLVSFAPIAIPQSVEGAGLVAGDDQHNNHSSQESQQLLSPVALYLPSGLTGGMDRVSLGSGTGVGGSVVEQEMVGVRKQKVSLRKEEVDQVESVVVNVKDESWQKIPKQFEALSGNEGLRRILEKVQFENQVKDGEIHSLREEVRVIKEMRKQREEEVILLKRQIKTANSQLQRTEEVLTDVHAQMEKSNAEVERLTIALQNSETTITDLLSVQDSLSGEVTALKSEGERVRGELKRSRSKEKQLKDELSRAVEGKRQADLEAATLAEVLTGSGGNREREGGGGGGVGRGEGRGGVGGYPVPKARKGGGRKTGGEGVEGGRGYREGEGVGGVRGSKGGGGGGEDGGKWGDGNRCEGGDRSRGGKVDGERGGLLMTSSSGSPGSATTIRESREEFISPAPSRVLTHQRRCSVPSCESQEVCAPVISPAHSGGSGGGRGGLRRCSNSCEDILHLKQQNGIDNMAEQMILLPSNRTPRPHLRNLALSEDDVSHGAVAMEGVELVCPHCGVCFLGYESELVRQLHMEECPGRLSGKT